MKFSEFFTVVFLSSAFFCGSAQATPFWKVTLHGHITSGFDKTGVFGVGGRDLKGLEYSQTLISSVDPDNYQYVYGEPYYYAKWSSHLAGYYTHAPVFDFVTVDGNSVSFVWNSILYTTQSISGGLAVDPPEMTDSVSSFSQGATEDGYFKAYNSVSTLVKSLAFVTSKDFGQSLTVSLDESGDYDIYHRRVGYASFLLGGGLSEVSFEGLADLLTVSPLDLPYVTEPPPADPPPTDMPEPASLALVCIGLLGLAVRRNNQLP